MVTSHVQGWSKRITTGGYNAPVILGTIDFITFATQEMQPTMVNLMMEAQVVIFQWHHQQEQFGGGMRRTKSKLY